MDDLATPITPSSESLAAALEHFRSLVDPQTLNALQPMGPSTIYTPWVTTWLLLYQRLHKNASLQSAVDQLLPIVGSISTTKRARTGTLSSNTTAYSRARSRLKLEVADAVADHVFESIVAARPPSWAGAGDIRRETAQGDATGPCAYRRGRGRAGVPAPARRVHRRLRSAGCDCGRL